MCGSNNIVVNCGCCCGKGGNNSNNNGGSNTKSGRCMLMPSADGNAGVGSIIPFDKVVECEGLTYSSADGTIHLLKDHTYRLEAFVRFTNSQGAELWGFYNKTTDTFIAGAEGDSDRNLVTYSNSNAALTIFTPTEDCDVCVKVTRSYDSASKQTTEFKPYSNIHSYFVVSEM